MIFSIKLQNFQNHKEKQIEFKEGINVISGSSNIGKSALIKAVNWVINGEPNGNSIIKYNAKECRVKIDIDNNIIEKVKSDKENKYIINSIELNSVGQSVPEEIKELTNFNELNLHMQFSPFFLLQDSPGEVTRKLNKIIDLEASDKIIKNAKNKVNDKKRKIDVLEDDIRDIRKQLERYQDLNDIGKIINKLDTLENEKNVYLNRLGTLKTIKVETNRNKEELKKYKNNEKISKIIKKLKDIFEDYNKKVLLYSMLIEYKNNKEEIKNIQNKVYNLKQLRGTILNNIEVCPIYNKMCPLNKDKK